jgi:hypothetical protein
MSTESLPILFVGCSSESIELGEAVQSNLASVAHVKLWNQGTFKPTHSYLRDLLHECKSAAFAIFILSPDDITRSRNAEEVSPRDNIIFEAGLFMGALGEERVFLLLPKNLEIKIPTDLSGITMPPYTAPPREGGSWQAALGFATNQIKNSIREIGRKPFLASYATEIFANSDDPSFVTLFKRLFDEANKVIMIGTGFYILRSDSMRANLHEHIRKGRFLEIYAANPFSPNVETRLIEEETGNPKPMVGQRGLIEWWDELLAERGKKEDKSNCILRLFPFYPTYALFIFDDHDYFLYPYGYIQLGTSSPVMHFIRGVPDHENMISFLTQQLETVKERSTDAELIFDIYNTEKENKKVVRPDQLTAFAVYLVPSANSSLYKFGSEILGYDVRAKSELHPIHEWPEAIGPASDFGIHVTIADALYCAHEKDIDLICEEVKCVARQFDPFILGLSMQKDFPNEEGIALVCEDKSGSLEALHHEMVARVYRKAVASNYSLGLAEANRDLDVERAELMIEHYHAPYILQRFKPHFSLLSAVPSKQKDQIYDKLKELYEEQVGQSTIHIRRIAIMHRPDPKGHWQIYREYNFVGGKS